MVLNLYVYETTVQTKELLTEGLKAGAFNKANGYLGDENKSV